MDKYSHMSRNQLRGTYIHEVSLFGHYLGDIPICNVLQTNMHGGWIMSMVQDG